MSVSVSGIFETSPSSRFVRLRWMPSFAMVVPGPSHVASVHYYTPCWRVLAHVANPPYVMNMQGPSY